VACGEQRGADTRGPHRVFLRAAVRLRHAGRAAIAQATTPSATNKTQQQFKKETKNSQKKTAPEEKEN
jgi:hypothetical protein